MSKILRLEAETEARYQEIVTARVVLNHVSARLFDAQEVSAAQSLASYMTKSARRLLLSAQN
jgi:hypothetical protein